VEVIIINIILFFIIILRKSVITIDIVFLDLFYNKTSKYITIENFNQLLLFYFVINLFFY